MARMLGGGARVRGGALLDRDAPVDAVFLGRVIARRLVIRAAVVPDDDVALAPLVAILAPGLDHVVRQLVDQLVALPRVHALDAQDLARIEVEALAPRLRMRADDRVKDGRPVTVLLVEEGRGLAATAVGEGSLPSLQALLQPGRQRLVGRVHAGEERVAARARHGEGIELGRLERLLIVGAVRVPALGASAIDGLIELAVGPELVDAQQGDLGIVRVTRHLRRVRVHDPEAAAIAEEVLDLELLTRHHEDVGIQPRSIDDGETRVVELPDVDPVDLRAYLRPQAANLDHRYVLLSWCSEPSGADSLERGHHLVRQELEASRLELRRNAAARIPPGHDAVEPQLFTKLAQPIDHARGGAEHHFLGEDVLIGQTGDALGQDARSIGGTRAGPADRGAGQLGLASEEGREALARLIPGALGGGGDVDGDAEVDARRTGMARLAPGFPVRRELSLQVGDLRGAEPDEDGQSHPAGRGKGLLARGRHANGRMRILIGARRHRGVVDAVELALVAEGRALPGLPDDLEPFAKAGLALGVRHAVGVIRAHDAAAADAELEAALADVVDGRDFLGDAQGVVQGKDLDGCAHADSPRAGGDGARHLERGGDHRARRGEMDLAEPDTVDSPGLGPVGLLEDVPERRDLIRSVTDLLDKDPEMHAGCLPGRYSPPARTQSRGQPAAGPQGPSLVTNCKDLLQSPLRECSRTCRRLKKVQMRGGARRPQARRTLCTLSLRSRAPTKQMGLFQPPARGPGPAA